MEFLNIVRQSVSDFEKKIPKFSQKFVIDEIFGKIWAIMIKLHETFSKFWPIQKWQTLCWKFTMLFFPCRITWKADIWNRIIFIQTYSTFIYWRSSMHSNIYPQSRCIIIWGNILHSPELKVYKLINIFAWINFSSARRIPRVYRLWSTKNKNYCNCT